MRTPQLPLRRPEVIDTDDESLLRRPTRRGRRGAGSMSKTTKKVRHIRQVNLSDWGRTAKPGVDTRFYKYFYQPPPDCDALDMRGT